MRSEINKKRDKVREIFRSSPLFDGPYSHKTRITARFIEEKDAQNAKDTIAKELPSNKIYIKKSRAWSRFPGVHVAENIFRVTVMF